MPTFPPVLLDGGVRGAAPGAAPSRKLTAPAPAPALFTVPNSAFGPDFDMYGCALAMPRNGAGRSNLV